MKRMRFEREAGMHTLQERRLISVVVLCQFKAKSNTEEAQSNQLLNWVKVTSVPRVHHGSCMYQSNHAISDRRSLDQSLLLSSSRSARDLYCCMLRDSWFIANRDPTCLEQRRQVSDTLNDGLQGTNSASSWLVHCLDLYVKR